ncbi:MAG: hypothetical protein EA387_04455 [Nitriliruptor sp.]|nr:MAG: hypothetical protein EA387_04455 [Nitriliruptor sp.]
MASWAAVALVAIYSSPGTRQADTTQLRLWLDGCTQHQLQPLAGVRRPHVELYARDLEAGGLAAATLALKLVVLTGFYRDCPRGAADRTLPGRARAATEGLTGVGPARNRPVRVRCVPPSHGAIGWQTIMCWPACSPSTPCACLRRVVRTSPTWPWRTDTESSVSSAKEASLHSSRLRHAPRGRSTRRSVSAPTGRCWLGRTTAAGTGTLR